MNVRPRLHNESETTYQRRVEAAERQTYAADDLRAYMRGKMSAALQRLAENIRVVEDAHADVPADVCQTCGGLGLIRYDVPLGHARFGKLYPCPASDCPARAQQQARRADSLLDKSGVPGTYRAFSFETWLALPAELRQGKDLAGAVAWVWSQKLAVSLSEAAALLQHPDSEFMSTVSKTWLVLQGDLGVGKTGLAAAATNALAAAGHQPVFYRLQEMFSEIQKHYGDNETGRNADDIISSIQRAEILILDECNVQRVSEDKARLFEEVIRYRHARQLPTLLTLNANQNEFEKAWGRRAADVTFSSAHWLTLTGKRLRRTDGEIKGF